MSKSPRCGSAFEGPSFHEPEADHRRDHRNSGVRGDLHLPRQRAELGAEPVCRRDAKSRPRAGPRRRSGSADGNGGQRRRDGLADLAEGRRLGIHDHQVGQAGCARGCERRDDAGRVHSRRADPARQAGQGRSRRVHVGDPAHRQARGGDQDRQRRRLLRRRLHPAQRPGRRRRVSPATTRRPRRAASKS